MAERRRTRWLIGWILTVAIVVFAIWAGDADNDRTAAEQNDEPGQTALRITSISEADVNPGDAVVVHFEGAAPDTPIEGRIAHRPAEVVTRAEDTVVVRVPSDVAPGKAALRIIQGERRSKSWDLHVHAANYRKLGARLLGGLALFVFGLGVLALGVRGLAGQRVRRLLARFTSSPTRAIGAGVMAGSVTQLTTSSTAFISSLVEARLLGVAAVPFVFVGAQLGASITGALIPVALTRESLYVLGIGVMWTQLARTRRGQAIAQLVVGAGLMLYGLHLLQTSIQPLVGDPKLLPLLAYLQGDGIVSIASCVAAGAVLAFVLQGPGPVYILVVGLAQVSGTMPLANALAILGGANLGAAAGMAVVALQGRTRVLAGIHVAFGAAALLVVVLGSPLWTSLGTALATDTIPAHGNRVVHGNISAQLAIAFLAAQLVAVLAWIPVGRVLARRVTDRPEEDAPATAPALEVKRELATALALQREALDIALETSCTSERKEAARAEEALASARTTMEQLYARLQRVSAGDESLEQQSRITVSALQLQRVIEQLVHVAELGVERRVVLKPAEQTKLRAIHELARTSCDALIEALSSGQPIDLEAAGAREIQMNLLEAEARSASATATRTRDSTAVALGLAELVDTYEHLGNHLYRVANAMSTADDELI